MKDTKFHVSGHKEYIYSSFMTIPHTRDILPLVSHLNDLTLKLSLLLRHLTLWLILSGDLPHLSDLSIDTALHLEESTSESVVVL